MSEVPETNILVFGASTTHGAWDSEGGGWVGRLNRFLMERVQRETDPYFTVYNLGINGDTSRGLLQRFEREAEVRFVKAERNVVIFAIGINDAVRLDDREYQVPPEEFGLNIKSLVGVARKFGKVILVGLTPVEETRTTPIPWGELRWYYRNEPLRAYNEMLKRIAADEALPFVDVLPAFTAGDYSGLMDDGLHPNSKGHQKIFEIAKTQLSNHGII